MKEYGLIGLTLGHSFSRNFFTEKFKHEDIDACYLNFELPDIRCLRNIILEHPDLEGLNCTIPYKETILPYLDEISPEAREIGAVNVIKIQRNKSYSGGRCMDGIRLTGFNSDIIGFTGSIAPMLKPHHKKALILGTGGAAKAVKAGLEKLGIQCTFVSRHISKDPKGLKTSNLLTYSEITTNTLQEHHVIVNCTPVGMFPHTAEAPALPYEALSPDHLLYDLVYNPETTMFLQNGAQHGTAIKNGQEMLELQALASWDIWTSEQTPRETA